jgi:hypothetical protein
MNNENNFITYLITTITRSWGDESLDNTDKPSDTQSNKDTEQ